MRPYRKDQSPNRSHKVCVVNADAIGGQYLEYCADHKGNDANQDEARHCAAFLSVFGKIAGFDKLLKDWEKVCDHLSRQVHSTK
jgi:hypothetical protein